ncbi:MAG: PilW family protein [Steroidobacteraceae bacterium]
MAHKMHVGQRQRGVTLIELMVAMVLGLIVIAGAVSVTIANRRSYSTNEGLSQVQESSRSAFELLARDIRQTGLTGCDNRGRTANVLVAGSRWWQTWYGLRGLTGAQAGAAPFGTARFDRVAGTDAVQTQGVQGMGMSLATHAPTTATMVINAALADVVVNDVLVVCNFDHAAIFQVTNFTAPATLTHAEGGPAPGNCSTGLGFPTICTTAGNSYQFTRNSLVAPLAATEWYIGQSGRAADSGRSLMRRRLARGGSVAIEELVTDVTNMTITYRVADTMNFVAASAVAATDWPTVNAIKIDLTILSADARVTTTPGTNNGRIERSSSQIFALRNRVP